MPLASRTLHARSGSVLLRTGLFRILVQRTSSGSWDDVIANIARELSALGAWRTRQIDLHWWWRGRAISLRLWLVATRGGLHARCTSWPLSIRDACRGRPVTHAPETPRVKVVRNTTQQDNNQNNNIPGRHAVVHEVHR